MTAPLSDQEIKMSDDDYAICEACEAKVLAATTRMTEDGCDLCAECWAGLEAEWAACEHVMEPYDDDRVQCEKCGVIKAPEASDGV